MDQDPTTEQIDHLIESALQEDLGAGDITTRSTVGENLIYESEVVARGNMVVCGLEIFSHRDGHLMKGGSIRVRKV